MLFTYLEPRMYPWAQPLRPGRTECVRRCQEEGAVGVICERDDAGVCQEGVPNHNVHHSVSRVPRLS